MNYEEIAFSIVVALLFTSTFIVEFVRKRNHYHKFNPTHYEWSGFTIFTRLGAVFILFVDILRLLTFFIYTIIT